VPLALERLSQERLPERHGQLVAGKLGNAQAVGIELA
jgi:hypothetical protein